MMFNIAIFGLTLIVALTFIFGILNFFRSGSPMRSQLFMRWRVLLQLLAIVIVMLLLLLNS